MGGTVYARERRRETRIGERVVERQKKKVNSVGLTYWIFFCKQTRKMRPKRGKNWSRRGMRLSMHLERWISHEQVWRGGLDPPSISNGWEARLNNDDADVGWEEANTHTHIQIHLFSRLSLICRGYRWCWIPALFALAYKEEGAGAYWAIRGEERTIFLGGSTTLIEWAPSQVHQCYFLVCSSALEGATARPREMYARHCGYVDVVRVRFHYELTDQAVHWGELTKYNMMSSDGPSLWFLGHCPERDILAFSYPACSTHSDVGSPLV